MAAWWRNSSEWKDSLPAGEMLKEMVFFKNWRKFPKKTGNKIHIDRKIPVPFEKQLFPKYECFIIRYGKSAFLANYRIPTTQIVRA